jgi:hypothetical protein
MLWHAVHVVGMFISIFLACRKDYSVTAICTAADSLFQIFKRLAVCICAGGSCLQSEGSERCVVHNIVLPSCLYVLFLHFSCCLRTLSPPFQISNHQGLAHRVGPLCKYYANDAGFVM